MKRTGAALLAACLAAAWAAPAVQADGPIVAMTPQGLYGVNWPTPDIQVAPEDADHPGLTDRDPFTAGSFVFEMMSGYFPKANLGPKGPRINYLTEEARLGVMLNDPHPARMLFSGVFEVLLDYTYAPIVSHTGNYFTGPSAFLRYDFVRPGWCIIPYLQGGTGFVLNDAWRDQTQRLIGEDFEFYLRAEFGLRVMLTENISLNLEGGYQHISNADLAPRNGGLNSLGGAIGFTYFFR